MTIDTNPVDAETVELDDIDAYIATFDEKERQELAAAEAAIDVAILLHRARERRGLSRGAAAALADLHQQAVSRLGRPSANPQLESIQAYLSALGYALALKAVDIATDETAAEITLPPVALSAARRRRSSPRRGPRSKRRQAPVEHKARAAAH
jgi:DNA-binding phage protein